MPHDPHNKSPQQRAADTRARNAAAAREAAERAAEVAGVSTARADALSRAARQQYLREKSLLGSTPKSRFGDIRAALDQAGYKTRFDPADFSVTKGEHESGRKYIETEYIVVVRTGDNDTRTVSGSIRFYGSSQAELRAAIFAKEGASSFDSGDVEAVITGDIDLPE